MRMRYRYEVDTTGMRLELRLLSPENLIMRSLLLLALGRLSISFELRPGPRLFQLRLRPSALTTSKMANTATDDESKALVVDPFCFRQFSEHPQSQPYGGTIFSLSIAEFEDIVNARYRENPELKEGYAPFCKHLFVRNDFTDAVVNVLPITPENEGMLRSKYEARNEKELPVLTRYFPLYLVGGQDKLPKAKYLDLILYSREQINKENAAQKRDTNPETAPWGIVSIKAQDTDYELPMTPMTAMRNALGKEEGGSGIPLDREAYLEAVSYWKDHATVS